MDLNSIDIAASALISNRLKMDLVAGNLANIHTTRNAQGEAEPYKRKVANFQTILDAQNYPAGVTVDTITDDDSEFKRVYDPGHPDANQEGYVFFPNIDTEKEMVEMMSAKGAYESSTKVIQAMKSMFNASLEI